MTLANSPSIRTAAQRDRHPWRISHDWTTTHERDAVAERVCGAAAREIAFQSFDRRQLPHARELEITWSDGASCTVRLDQGVGYWHARGDARFGFDARTETQADTLRDARLPVAAGAPSTRLSCTSGASIGDADCDAAGKGT